MPVQERIRRLLPGLWAGLLLCVALVATPAPFATLATADAGRVVGRILANEAYASLALGIALLVLERMLAVRLSLEEQGSQFSTGMLLVLGAIFLTVAGHFGLQPMVQSARLSPGPLSFGQLHALSLVLFVAKGALVMALAWRAASAPRAVSQTASS